VTDLLAMLAAATVATPERATLTVDLLQQRIDTPNGSTIAFEVNPLRREALIEGLDSIALTLKRTARIDAFQARQRHTRPWVWEI